LEFAYDTSNAANLFAKPSSDSQIPIVKNHALKMNNAIRYCNGDMSVVKKRVGMQATGAGVFFAVTTIVLTALLAGAAPSPALTEVPQKGHAASSAMRNALSDAGKLLERNTLHLPAGL
jgi:hypothetical protein